MNELASPVGFGELVVHSDLLGDLRLANTDVISFAGGLLGFPECQRFALIGGAHDGLFWLQSLDYSALAFLLIDPFSFVGQYSVDLSPLDIAHLAAEEPSDVALLTIVTLPRAPGESATTNLQGPLAINMHTRLGKQLVCDGVEYGVRCPVDLMPAVA